MSTTHDRNLAEQATEAWKAASAGTTPLRSFRIANELWQRAAAKAEERGESLSDVIRRALEEYAPVSGMIAERRVQIREAGDPDTDSSLVQHVAGEHDLPACGQPVRFWHGKEMRAVLTGRGVVTCSRPGCAG